MSGTPRIEAALRTILEDCCGAVDPLMTLTEHIDRLKSNPAWEPQAVAEVELAAARILSSLLDR